MVPVKLCKSSNRVPSAQLYKQFRAGPAALWRDFPKSSDVAHQPRPSDSDSDRASRTVLAFHLGSTRMTDVQQASSSFAALPVGELDSLPGMTQVPPSDSPTEVSFDAVSSLRAAALSSLRMKRKKVSDSNPKATILSRHDIPQNAMTLDYGAEEPPKATSATPERTDAQKALDKQEDEAMASAEDTREEGEISDEEDGPVASDDTPRISHALGKTSISDENRSSRTKSPSPRLSRREKAEISIQSTYQQQHPLIDEQHVRPGLTSACHVTFFCWHGIINGRTEQ